MSFFPIDGAGWAKVLRGDYSKRRRRWQKQKMGVWKENLGIVEVKWRLYKWKVEINGCVVKMGGKGKE